MSRSILLIGKPHSSKTVFLTQFYSRLQKKKSKLTLYQPVGDLSPISAARKALANGEGPQPTPAEASTNFYLPIQLNDSKINLSCPEYGGEQVTGIVENRELSKDWTNAIKESDNWILFIRLNSISKSLDISEVTYSEQHKQNTEKTGVDAEYKISDQSFFVELLQILLHAKQSDLHHKNDKVKLTVVLTCWDEMQTELTPHNLITEKLPLFLSFIESNWGKSNLKIIGLSAQGFSLDIPENKEKYQIDGPEEFGYLVLENGRKTNDITSLIEQALF